MPIGFAYVRFTDNTRLAIAAQIYNIPEMGYQAFYEPCLLLSCEKTDLDGNKWVSSATLDGVGRGLTIFNSQGLPIFEFSDYGIQLTDEGSGGFYISLLTTLHTPSINSLFEPDFFIDNNKSSLPTLYSCKMLYYTTNEAGHYNNLVEYSRVMNNVESWLYGFNISLESMSDGFGYFTIGLNNKTINTNQFVNIVSFPSNNITVFSTISADNFYNSLYNGTGDDFNKSILNCEITLSPKTFIYDGSPKKPFVTVIDDEYILTENIHYTVGYFNNVNVGIGKVNIAGINRYINNRIVTFEITDENGNIPDPYNQAGTSDTNTGNGTYNFSSTEIPFSTLPTLNMAQTGFTRIYNPNLAQLQALARYMWTDNTFMDTIINTVKKLIENPIDAIISLNLLPCQIPNGEAEEVKVLFIPTGVYMPPATTQFVEVDCGSISLTETYGSALDYNPYTQVSLFLPYIGQIKLDTDEVMGKTISVKYHIDIVTGMCVAQVAANGTVLYQYTGHCAVSMPLTSADFSTYLGAFIQASKMLGGTVAGSAGLIEAENNYSVAKALKNQIDNSDEDTDFKSLINRHYENQSRILQNEYQLFGDNIRRNFSNTVSAVMGSKTIVEHAGGFSGASGYLGIRYPYLIVKIPRIANPNNYAKYNGKPSMVEVQLSECHGYTEVQNIQLTDISATADELSEIGELLSNGVIL